MTSIPLKKQTLVFESDDLYSSMMKREVNDLAVWQLLSFNRYRRPSCTGMAFLDASAGVVP